MATVTCPTFKTPHCAAISKIGQKRAGEEGRFFAGMCKWYRDRGGYSHTKNAQPHRCGWSLWRQDIGNRGYWRIGREEVAAALVIMGARANGKRKEERERSVRVANPDSVALSAFFFAAKLQKELGIPVAFIDAT